MNITLKINSPLLIQTITEKLSEEYVSEMCRINSNLLKNEVSTKTRKKFETKINKHCWFAWTTKRNKKNQSNHIYSWMERNIDLFYKPSYLSFLMKLNNLLSLVITNKQEEISVELSSCEFELIKNTSVEITRLREEYINYLVDHCYRSYTFR